MIPVVEEDHAEILVIVGRGRAIDDDATKDTLVGLEREVGVIPARAILGCLPGVCDRFPDCNGALGHSSHAIMLIRVVLSDPMEMKTRAIEGS
jgi:hypothetical protein